MQKMKMSVKKFNCHVKRAYKDTKSLEALYLYCTGIIREKLRCSYREKSGENNYYNTVPHDVFTRVIIEYPPKEYIENPVAFLCRATVNYMTTDFWEQDNHTLELFDNYPYIPDYENNIEFSDATVERKWYQLDELTRYILYLNICHDYKLFEIAEILNLTYDVVRTKKSRALKQLKLHINDIKQKEEVLT